MKNVCHSMWPCNWTIVPPLFQKDDVVHFMDSNISTPEQLHIFSNLTQYVLEIGGGVVADNCLIDGTLYELNESDFFLELSPFNESVLGGFHFTNFNIPVLSLRGMEFFMIFNCSWNNCHISYDYPLISFCNISCIMTNSSISDNSVEGTPLIGLYTAILGLYESIITKNIQLSRGPIPLIEFTNGASEISNSSIIDNISPNSPLIGSWFFLLAYFENSTFESNYCGNSGLIIGDSIANVTVSNSKIFNNRGSFLHSMTMSELNCSNSNFSFNYAAGQSLIFAPRSKIHFLNQTYVSNNIALSILSSQLTNETSLELVSTIFSNNTNHDIGFALESSQSIIENATISSNTVIDNPFLSLKASNFSISNASFRLNWASTVIDVIDSSLNISKSNFMENKGYSSGVFEVTTKKENLTFLFSEDNFSKNSGDKVKSVLFNEIIPPVIFEYCNFEKLRFEEVNGDLDKEQLFHRCRFENSSAFETIFNEKTNPISTQILIFLCLYIILIMFGIIVFLYKRNQHQHQQHDLLV